MKYPSVFFTILFVWLVIDVVALFMNQTRLTLDLYYWAIVFSVVTFLIGFWRNK